MRKKPPNKNITCLNAKYSVLPCCFLNAKEPVALYTASKPNSDNRITANQMYWSPLNFNLPNCIACYDITVFNYSQLDLPKR